MADELVLFDGRVGSERVRVWLQAHGDGIALMSHDIGPGVERNFGKDDLETILVIAAADLPALIAALREGHEGGTGAPPDSDEAMAIRLLAERFAGNSAATSMLRLLLDKAHVRYDFTIV
jgi:hypothetical protein